MLDTTRLEGLIIEVYNNTVHATIETQVILQLLVKKGIVTPEEVATTRILVSNQPKYKEMIELAKSAIDKNNEDKKFEDLFTKSLRPGPDGKASLTNEEREYLLNKLDKFK